MRLSKIQKFLKENNINYDYSVSTTFNSEFGEIRIKDDKTNYTTISEITGTKGNKPSGIMLFRLDKETKKSISNTLTSQNEIIERIKKDIEK